MPTKRFSTRSTRPTPCSPAIALSLASSVDRRQPLAVDRDRRRRARARSRSYARRRRAPLADRACAGTSPDPARATDPRGCRPRSWCAAGCGRSSTASRPSPRPGSRAAWCTRSARGGDLNSHSRHGAMILMPGSEVVRGELEAHLIVALAGRAVRDRVGALRAATSIMRLARCTGARATCRAGTASRTARRRAAREHEVAHELVAQVATTAFVAPTASAFLRAASRSSPCPTSAQKPTTSQRYFSVSQRMATDVSSPPEYASTILRIRHARLYADLSAGCRAGTAGRGAGTPRAAACRRRRGSRRSTAMPSMRDSRNAARGLIGARRELVQRPRELRLALEVAEEVLEDGHDRVAVAVDQLLRERAVRILRQREIDGGDRLVELAVRRSTRRRCSSSA